MKKALILAVALILPIPIFAQGWVARYNGPADSLDYANAIAVDGSGNVYVTGQSYDSDTKYDYATVKYDSSGVEQWVERYNGPDNLSDEASAIAVDGDSNVYVTGGSWGSDTKNDYATIKYDSSGDTVWVRRYNGPGNDNDRANVIAVDGDGNVYVTGYSMGSGTADWDYATIKYNSSGDTVWVRRYNEAGNDWDEANAIVVDDSGNVYVTGRSGGSMTGWDYATIKYNSSGVELWVERYDGPRNGSDRAYAIAVDDSGNVYVTGESFVGGIAGKDYATIKYNSSGTPVWVRRYDGSGTINSCDVAEAIAVDGSGNVYVTGWSEGSGTDMDYATIKYNSSGDSMWVKRYNGPDNSKDCARAIAVDGDYVYVTGYSYGLLGTGRDYATIKYSCAGVEEETGNRHKAIGISLEIYPNPSFGNALIKYGLPEKADISLKLYDISGRLVRTIYSGTQEKGYYEVDIKQDGLIGGIYFIRLDTGNYKATKKLTILR